MLVEVVPEPVQGPGAEGQAELGGIGQRGGEDLGDLLRGIGGRASGAGLVLQAVGPLEVEPPDPAVDGGARDAQGSRHLGGALAFGGGQDNLGALDGAGRRGTGMGQRLDLLAFLGCQGSERDSLRHGGGLHSDAPLILRHVTWRMHHIMVRPARSLTLLLGTKPRGWGCPLEKRL